MPDHYHLLATLKEDHRTPSLVGRVNSLSARRVNSLLGRRGRIWSRRFYDHVVRNQEDFDQCCASIHDNPRAAGLVGVAGEYPYSSARFFEGLSSPWGPFDPA